VVSRPVVVLRGVAPILTGIANYRVCAMESVVKKPKLDNVKRFAVRTSTVEFSTFEDPDTGVWEMS
jgi:hypothetical protein